MAAPILIEKRLLLASTAGTLLAFLFQIIAVSTTHWLTFYIDGGHYEKSTGKNLSEVYSGLWRVCKVYIVRSDNKEVKSELCTEHNLFPSSDELNNDGKTDAQLLDYMRTGSAFGIISLLIMFLGHFFAFYTLRRPRYIIKRLTALLHLMTAACVLVENEVFIRRVEHADNKLPERMPETATHTYGYSFILSWIAFVFYVLAGIVFLLTSHKRKAEMADVNDDHVLEDEPVAIRR